MSAVPLVSVVMSVYNGADALHETIESVLAQEGVDFEFIIVNDGSRDASGAMLDAFASADSRIRAIHQTNQGLTKALIHGCALAQGKYIARQDCGDRSLPGRLRAEVDIITTHADAALVSCATLMVGPSGEPLYNLVLSAENAANGLTTLDIEKLHGPAHHGSTLFRRDLYENVGGYRAQFYFAQDLDLWTRLIEHGSHIALTEFYYEAAFTLGSISGMQRHRQIACAKLILESARLRREGQSDETITTKARAIIPDGKKATPRDRAAALYFVGRCLSRRRDARAKNYYRDALRAHPFHLKSALRLLLG